MAPGDQRTRTAAPPSTRRTPALSVCITDAAGRPLRLPTLGAWLRKVAPRRSAAVTIVLATDRQMRALNDRFRGRDYATDVLSFPVEPWPGVPAIPGPVSLGDVVIARSVARRQARMAGHSELTELKILALHGLLHLLGYDHETDAGRMRQAEMRLRRKGGLREGLIERGHRS